MRNRMTTFAYGSGTGSSNPTVDTSGRTPVSSSAAGAADWVLPSAAIDMDFANNRYYGVQPAGLTFTRSTVATDLLYTAASGASYNTYAINQKRITTGIGLLLEEQRTNNLLNSTVPATQTTASLGTGAYTLWVNGSGSALASAGTATINSASAATNGSPNVFNVTGAGTVTVTVTGSLNAFQLELGTWGTSLIVTAGATATRTIDSATVTAVPVFGSAVSLFGSGFTPTPNAFANGTCILSISDGTTNNRIQLSRLGVTGVPTLFNTVASVAITTLAIGAGAWGPNVASKVAASVTAGSQLADYNGINAASASGASIPSSANLTAIKIGNRPDGSIPWNGYVTRIAVWPNTMLSAGTLTAITL